MNILFSGFIDPSHSSCGGYDKITQIDCPKKVLLSNNYFCGKSKISSHLTRIPFTLLDIHTRLVRRHYDITHLFYGELTMLFFLPYKHLKRNKTVITLHLDIEKRRNTKLFVKLLRHFDGIIVLSSQQKEYLWEKYKLRSIFIPHGFSKPNFTLSIPQDIKNNTIDLNKINLLTIGSNYRDFDSFRTVVNHFKNNDKYVFHLVGAPKYVKDEFIDADNVFVYNRLNNNEYYTLISISDYCFLPLTFATANNTLLEAQYLNLPSILPDIPGVMDYAAPSPNNLFYDDQESLIHLISSLVKSSKNNELYYFAKEHFDWDVIYRSLIDYYNCLKSDSIYI